MGEANKNLSKLSYLQQGVCSYQGKSDDVFTMFSSEQCQLN